MPGAHHQDPATTPYSCHGVFTDLSIFSLNLCRTQFPTGTLVTNCNHKHGLMLTCRQFHMKPHCFILTEACSCRLELAYFAGKVSKNRLVCKNALALAYYGSCRLLVMGSCWSSWCFSVTEENSPDMCIDAVSLLKYLTSIKEHLTVTTHNTNR